MESHIAQKADNLKKNIIDENRGNKNKKRIFSKKLKNEICNFIYQEKIHPSHASAILGIAHSTLGKWLLDSQDAKTFKRVSISAPLPAKNVMKNFKEFSPMKLILVNQIALTTLIALLIIEKIFLRLI